MNCADGLRIETLQQVLSRATELRSQGIDDLADAICAQALELCPEQAEQLNVAGVLSAQAGHQKLAAGFFRRAVRASEGAPTAHNNLGIVLTNLGHFREAVCEFDAALARHPLYADAWSNRATALAQLQQVSAAIADCDRALALDAHNIQAHLNKAVCCLLLGDFERGWPLYEWRKGAPPHRGCAPPPAGAAATAATLFAEAECGVGDTIQFCRYLRSAHSLGFSRKMLAAPRALWRLLGSLDRSIELVDFDAQPPADCELVTLMSLPLRFATRQDNIPDQVPYLGADPDRVAHWRRRLGPHGFKVGVCWQTGAGFGLGPWNHGRAFPLSAIRPLAAIPSVRLVCLQKSPLPAGLDGNIPLERLAGLDAGPDAFVDTAAVMESLDLIISADTAVAHLAGAMARPTWIALQRLPDWRWQLERTDSPWYPSVRLFRQTTPGAWEPVFEHMAHELSRLVAQRAVTG
jgi:hypothetical protein